MTSIKKIAKNLIGKLPGGNYIVFESAPVLSDNSRAVFDEMLRRGMQKKYRMYWWVNDRKADLPKFSNTGYLDLKTAWNRLRFRWITIRAKCLICCNSFLTVTNPSQTAFYLTHGTALKKLNDYYLPEGITYTLVASEQVKDVMARELRADPETVVALGYPRNDILHQPSRDLHEVFPGTFRKVVVWYPTYRQHKNGLKTDSKDGLPVLHDPDSALRLNEMAKELGILIVVKPHFAQDLSYIKQYDLSNILFIDDSFFAKNNLTSYEFVGSCDALITDYSSIFFDYLLCGKPVAVIWEDIEDYRQNPGFAMDPEVYMAGSHRIYSLADYEEFLRCLAAGRDPYREERYRLCELLNYAADGENARRVVDFIMEKANLKQI